MSRKERTKTSKRNFAGIYSLELEGKFYVGMDSNITSCARFLTHMRDFEANNHFNQEMQDAFNSLKEKGEQPKFSILELHRHIDKEDLLEREEYWIAKLDSFNNGYNKTKGGYGLKGYKYTPEQLENSKMSRIGEKSATAKIGDEDFYTMIEMFKKGYDNETIAKEFDLHDRYVSLIRGKKRWQVHWQWYEEEFGEYTPEKSNKLKDSRKVNYEEYKAVWYLHWNYVSNNMIQHIFDMGGGTVSRILSNKTLKDFYTDFSEELKMTPLPIYRGDGIQSKINIVSSRFENANITYQEFLENPKKYQY